MIIICFVRKKVHALFNVSISFPYQYHQTDPCSIKQYSNEYLPFCFITGNNRVYWWCKETYRLQALILFGCMITTATLITRATYELRLKYTFALHYFFRLMDQKCSANFALIRFLPAGFPHTSLSLISNSLLFGEQSMCAGRGVETCQSR